MNFCNNCGHKLPENSNFCPNCGMNFTNQNINQNINTNNFNVEQNNVQNESAGSLALVGIISFLIPIVGIILFYSYRKTNPQAARVANICTFANFILLVFSFILFKIVTATIY